LDKGRSAVRVNLQIFPEFDAAKRTFRKRSDASLGICLSAVYGKKSGKMHNSSPLLAVMYFGDVLLKYLKPKYFFELSVYDEGQYWETGDEAVLSNIFDRYEAAFEIMDDALNNNTRNAGESCEDYVKRILTAKGFKVKE
jgi:hypothetical protein